MSIRSLEELPVEGRRVFIRADFNVPRDEGGAISDDTRIRAALPTVRYCLERDARVIVASHLGRPDGVPDPAESLEPIGVHLSELLDMDVVLTDEPAGDGARKVVSDLRLGRIALLENLRFDPGETANDEAFARELASYADVYVNDAFGTAHRAHASTVGMVEHVADVGSGFLLAAEIAALGVLLGDVARPYLAILGGSKVSDKIEVLDALLERVDRMIIGGAMANTFLAAAGTEVGKSRVEADRFPHARNFLRKARDRGVPIILPTDVVVAQSIEGSGEAGSCRSVAVGNIAPLEMALDIGPESCARYASEIATARTIFWNGPMGVFEKPAFANGTEQVARAVADNSTAFSVVGGGDSAAAVVAVGVSEKVSHVSTGGGASLEFVQGIALPGITALNRN